MRFDRDLLIAYRLEQNLKLIAVVADAPDKYPVRVYGPLHRHAEHVPALMKVHKFPRAVLRFLQVLRDGVVGCYAPRA